MSYFNKIGYQIFKTADGNFEGMVDDLLSKIDRSGKILRFVFFSDISDNDDYSLKLDMIRHKVRVAFDDMSPVVTLVAQKPLDAGLVVEEHSYMADKEDCVEYKEYENFPYVLVKNAYGKFLYAGGLHSSFDKDIYSQGKEVFRLLGSILSIEGISVHSIVRQWNYIERITAFDGNGDQHYQMFNNSRSEFYASEDWSKGYPAATGIGTFAGGVVVDVDAVVESSIVVTPIDNRLQVAAHAYSDNVLENAETGLTTPKFERAKSLSDDGKRLIYVSGTAAIRGEESIFENVEKQLYVTLENIGELIGETDIRLFRVYLKNMEDYKEVFNAMPEYENVSMSYLHADVCRNELLIEIEGIALGK